MLGKDSKK